MFINRFDFRLTPLNFVNWPRLIFLNSNNRVRWSGRNRNTQFSIRLLQGRNRPTLFSQLVSDGTQSDRSKGEKGQNGTQSEYITL